MNKFYTLFPEILKQEGIPLLEKNLLCIFKGYQDNNKYCFETQKDLAELFGISERAIRYAINNLKTKGLIFIKSKSEVDNKAKWYNRKAIIMVDNNNPLPTVTDKESKDEEVIIVDLPIAETKVEVVIEPIKISKYRLPETPEKDKLNIYLDKLEIEHPEIKQFMFRNLKDDIKFGRVTELEEIDNRLNLQKV